MCVTHLQWAQLSINLTHQRSLDAFTWRSKDEPVLWRNLSASLSASCFKQVRECNEYTDALLVNVNHACWLNRENATSWLRLTTAQNQTRDLRNSRKMPDHIHYSIIMKFSLKWKLALRHWRRLVLIPSGIFSNSFSIWTFSLRKWYFKNDQTWQQLIWQI